MPRRPRSTRSGGRRDLVHTSSMEGQLVFAGISAFSGDQVRAGGLSEAVAALLGAETEEDAVGLVRLVTGYADSSDERARAIARWLSGLYGSGRLATYPAIVPLEPDLLAEVLVARELTALPELVGGAFDLAVDRQLSRALVVLSRAAAARDDLADVVRAALDERLPGLVHQFASRQIQDAELLTGLRLALQAIRPLAGAVAAMDELPQASTALAPLAVDVTTLAVEGLRNAASHDPDRYLPDLAGALNNLSVGLGGLGRPGDALAAVEEAVGHYRVLAKVNPDRYLPDLAGALNNLSVGLGGLGRPGDALAAVEEAVRICRVLAKANPDRYLPDHAMSLNNLSNRLGDLGRPGDALAAVEEAVGHYRVLAKANP